MVFTHEHELKQRRSDVVKSLSETSRPSRGSEFGPKTCSLHGSEPIFQADTFFYLRFSCECMH